MKQQNVFVLKAVFLVMKFIYNAQTLHEINYTKKKEKEKGMVAKISIYYLQIYFCLYAIKIYY